MLEDELTSILADDGDVKQLIVVDSVEQQGLARKLRSHNRPFLTTEVKRVPDLVKGYRRGTRSDGHSTERGTVGAIRRLLRQRSADDLVVVVHILRLGLHVDSALLKREVYSQIEYMASFSDGIFVLYGVCDALRTLEHDFDGSSCPLFFLADDDRVRVEDCVALALGGNQAYANVLTNDTDIVLFLTPMWAAHWQDLGDDFALMKHARFKKVAKVDTTLSYEPEFDTNARECARIFSLRLVSLRGNTVVIQKSYQRAKSSVRGNEASG
ncbi:MAG: DUF1638 domain-containing protein [Halobacteriota archaeon]